MGRNAGGGLPVAVRALLHSRIESLEQLEILMALRRDARSVRASELARQFGLSESKARHHLERLAGQGLLDVKLGADDVRYRFDAISTDLRNAVDQLVDCYTTSRSAVVGFVTSPARRSLRDFTAAFRFRRFE